MSNPRFHALQDWLNEQLQQTMRLSPLVADASFRRYYRVHLKDQTLVAMDAPPEQEDSQSFVKVAEILLQQGLLVPQILTSNLQQGFLLISDLGDDLYQHHLNTQTADSLYRQAIDSLITIQKIPQLSNEYHFPLFNTRMREELNEFEYWFLSQHLQITLDRQEQKSLHDIFEKLVSEALSQPQVCVHRDYHSRNLLIHQQQTAIIDFQDAVWGPVSYDLVSLLRDCYIDWPLSQVHAWVTYYYIQACQNRILSQVTSEQFIRWFDWMGIQRHLKAIFIFARKYRRDHNEAYLNDIPRALNYVLTVGKNYSELNPLISLLEKHVLPKQSRVNSQ